MQVKFNGVVDQKLLAERIRVEHNALQRDRLRAALLATQGG